MTELLATAADERPVFIEAAGHTLFGLVTGPTMEANGWGVVFLPGADSTPSTGRNRISVRMARQCAALGFHAMRVDYPGVGESTGTLTYNLTDPYSTDVAAAIEHLRSACGIDRVLLVGACFGGCAALAGAARTTTAKGVALLASPVRIETELPTREAVGRLAGDLARRALRPRVWRGLFDPERNRVYAQIVRRRVLRITRRLRRRLRGEPTLSSDGTNRRFVTDLESFAGRGGVVLMLYGTEDSEYADFCTASAGEVGDVFNEYRDLLRAEVIDGDVHGHTSLESQEAVLSRVEQWLLEMSGQDSDPRADVAESVWRPA